MPYNFSTSHVFLHHHLNGGKGDSFYQARRSPHTARAAPMLFPCKDAPAHPRGYAPVNGYAFACARAPCCDLARGSSTWTGAR